MDDGAAGTLLDGDALAEATLDVFSNGAPLFPAEPLETDPGPVDETLTSGATVLAPSHVELEVGAAPDPESRGAQDHAPSIESPTKLAVRNRMPTKCHKPRRRSPLPVRL